MWIEPSDDLHSTHYCLQCSPAPKLHQIPSTSPPRIRHIIYKANLLPPQQPPTNGNSLLNESPGVPPQPHTPPSSRHQYNISHATLPPISPTKAFPSSSPAKHLPSILNLGLQHPRIPSRKKSISPRKGLLALNHTQKGCDLSCYTSPTQLCQTPTQTLRHYPGWRSLGPTQQMQAIEIWSKT